MGIFGDKGDSGSLIWLADDGNPVALLHGGFNSTNIGRATMACDIVAVQQFLEQQFGCRIAFCRPPL